MLGWTLLVPVKPLPRGKSRLQAATADAAEHARLVTAIRRDTLRAAEAAAGVHRVVVIDQPGLNRALRAAADEARRHFPDDGIAALVADLPALRPAELDDALAAALAVGGRGFCADADGTGTTLLVAAPGADLRPGFGAGSAARHRRSGARALLGRWPGLRRDVDTPADLRQALEIGVGAHTGAALAGPIGSPG